MRAPLPTVSRRSRMLLVLVVVLLAISLLSSSLIGKLTDFWWFESVGFTAVFGTVLRARIGMFVVVGLALGLWMALNLWLAYRLQPPYRPMSLEQQNLERYRMWVTPRLRLIITVVALLCALVAGIAAQNEWQTWLQFANATPFGKKDPQFGMDLSFYMFLYPFYRYVLGMAFSAVALSLVGALILHWLYGGVRFQGAGERMSDRARLHLWTLLALFLGLKAYAYYLDRFGLSFSASDITGADGMSYADAHYLLPAKNILLLIAVFAAVMFLIAIGVRNVLLPGVALALLGLSAVLAGGVIPFTADQVYVKPNAAELESAYIKRNIDATRDGYAIANTKKVDYQGTGTVAPEKLANDPGIQSSARLLDPNILAPTFIQQQRGNGFYTFNDKLDIDRYPVGGGKNQDYVVGVRELDVRQLNGTQQNWGNLHKVFTHGYGFVAAPANQIKGDGSPCYVSGGFTDVQTADCAQKPIPVKEPRIYFGEKFADTYSVVGKAAGGLDQEMDRPGANGGQVKTTYTGKGGVSVDSFARRLAYAIELRAVNFALPGAVEDNSKVIYVRDPRARVEKVAPFLKVDGDPYPAVVNGRIQWIVDAYTTSASYPNSQSVDFGDVAKDSQTGTGTTSQPRDQVNYIRNSVKATVDAYDGTVKLYEWDKTDPVLKTWNKAFGNILTPREEISPELQSHFRYPEDLFKVQRELLSQYHVTDPQAFFSKQDFWRVPSDPTRPTTDPQPPYYLLSQFPGQEQPTFQLTSALNANKGESLAAIVTASYDKKGAPALTRYELPSTTSTQGPNQAQTQFTSNHAITGQLTAIGAGKTSTAIYGNLLSIPVGGPTGGLLYLQPLYVRPSTGTAAYPSLQLVFASYGGKIAVGNDLKSAIAQVFGATPNTTPPPEASPPSAQPPSTTTNPQVAAAVRDIQKAIDHLRTAQKAGDFAGVGQAQKELADASARFETAQRSAGANPTPAPSAVPSASGAPPGR